MVETEKAEKSNTHEKSPKKDKKDKGDKVDKKKTEKDSEKENKLILWFEDLTNDDVCYVGGKNASLGEMYRELAPKGIKIPNGFAVTAYAYNHFLDQCDLMDPLSEALDEAHSEATDLKKVGKKVRSLILKSEFPEDLAKAIIEAYRKLGGGDVAVRSSATAEDLPEASFAGQQESYLNVEGEEMLLEACKKCMASLFTNRAISYREDKGFNHFDVYLSVGVMKMVRSDKACAGTMFTIDTETGFSNAVLINGCWGLGENVVQGSVNPDEWTVFKPTLKKDFKPIIRKVLGSKKHFMVYGSEGTTSTVNMDTSQEHQDKFCLDDDEVLQLAKWGTIIEDHYSKRKGKYCPMDIEWAKDGNTNEIFIVQARPETVQSQRNYNILITYKLKGKKKADEQTVEQITEKNAKRLSKGKGKKEDEKKAKKAQKKLDSKKDKKKGAKEGEEEDEEDAEDDLKLTKPKSKDKKQEDKDNELIEKSKEEGKGEKKEGKDKDEKKDKEKKKEGKEEKKKEGKEEKKKGKDEKEKKAKEEKGKDKEKKKEKEESKEDERFLADTGKIATARHEEFSKNGQKDKSAEHKTEDEEVMASGAAVGAAIAVGKAKNILSIAQLHEFSKGEILITEMTDPDWEPILKLAAAIVTDSGGRTCHAAIIARELGIPCIVGCGDVTSKVKTGDAITVDCSRGDTGVVLKGIYDFEKTETDLGDLTKTKTKIMMNIADPERAFELSFIPNSGVGLGRLEFIINNHISVHPLAILHLDNLEKEEKEKILEKAKGFKDPREFFVSTLARGVGVLTAAFYPKPVIVRFSDFKTNEYANLLGGKHYEPKEDNPMLGWRGASRYYDPTYREGFALECEAMKRVREQFGLTNLMLMIPMLRTVDEAKRVLEEMKHNGIERSEGEEGLKVMAMCEVPSNSILAEQFLEILDGFSIGSNDLTQMTLGVDRDSQIVNDIFDERNLAVKEMIAHAITVCRKLKKYVGICGQAPSDYPEFAEWLVDRGIESMSLNPDTVIPATLRISQKERGLTKEQIEKENKDRETKASGLKEDEKDKKKEKGEKEKKSKEGKEKDKEAKKADKEKEKEVKTKEKEEQKKAKKADKEKSEKDKTDKKEKKKEKGSEKGKERSADDDKEKKIEALKEEIAGIKGIVGGMEKQLEELEEETKHSKPTH